MHSEVGADCWSYVIISRSVRWTDRLVTVIGAVKSCCGHLSKPLTLWCSKQRIIRMLCREPRRVLEDYTVLREWSIGETTGFVGDRDGWCRIIIASYVYISQRTKTVLSNLTKQPARHINRLKMFTSIVDNSVFIQNSFASKKPDFWHFMSLDGVNSILFV